MNIVTKKEIVESYVNSEQFKKLFPESVLPYVFLVHYQASEVIIQQGIVPEYLFYLVQGKCTIREYFPNGKAMILNSIYPYSLVGEIELVNEQDLSLSVSALTDCNLLAIPLDPCKELLLNDVSFLRQLSTILALKERQASKKLSHIFGYPLKNRLADFILENRQGDWFTIRKVEIAESLGVTYRHEENLKKQFIKECCLEHCKPDYLITDLQGLEELTKDFRN